MLDAVSKDSTGLPNTCRAVFVIGADKKLKLSILYPATTGRNFAEVLRVIDSLQLTATRRLATPANWVLGQDCIIASSVSMDEANKLFPGFKVVELPSKRPYLRTTPFPADAKVATVAAAPVAKQNLSSSDWAGTDKQLLEDESFKALHAKFSKPCSKESLDKCVAALMEQKHNVRVFETSKEALEFMQTLLEDKMSVSNGTSATLEQIGWIDYLKSQDSRINNLKGKAAKAAMENNMADHAMYLAQGAQADLFVSGITAATEDGEISAADLSGTRINGWLASKQLVVVFGSNKIVSNKEEAKQRLFEYQLKLESARVRVAYGVPASVVANQISLKAANPFAPRTTVVIIKEALGF